MKRCSMQMKTDARLKKSQQLFGFVQMITGAEGIFFQFCIDESRTPLKGLGDKVCPYNYKNRKKDEPLFLKSLCGSKDCKGYQRP